MPHDDSRPRELKSVAGEERSSAQKKFLSVHRALMLFLGLLVLVSGGLAPAVPLVYEHGQNR